ncbi:MAG: thiamine pyrophosphate-binding protein [Candidatus Omnitrophica bacterium]|nr:thiamine pyrophosphate-binding protein [Candidatus Omnitrophota bacterium]
MKSSDYIINFLSKNKVTHVFEVCGGAITHLLDSMYGRKDIAAVSMHHEQAAAFAAEGYSRASGNIGVAMATSGPGATNLITGIGSAFFDSTATLFITGQVNTYEFKFKKPIRQKGFQEADIVSIVRPIVKEAHLIDKPEKIVKNLRKAFYTAKSGRPGPVLLDIPMDIQRFNLPYKRADKVYNLKYINSRPSSKAISQIIRLLSIASRPVIISGGGVGISGARQELLLLLRKTGIPVVASLMGLDSCPHDIANYCGMLGTYGNRYANLTVANSDLVLALGTRLDTRQTGTVSSTFARGAKLIHIDIDQFELNNKIKADIGLVCDVKLFLAALNKSLTKYNKARILPWISKTLEFECKYRSWVNQEGNNIAPNLFMHILSGFLPSDAIVCLDVGQHQMWAGQSLELKEKQMLITQGGMASMGSSLPMAIGASFAQPNRPVVVITGDGGFQLNIQELETLRCHNLPVKIILLNNKGYGMIRQFQRQYFGSRFQSTVKGYSQPDFKKVVSAFGIPASRVEGIASLKSKLKELFKSNKPEFLEVMIGKNNLVLPKLAVNRPIEDQDPQLSFNELKSNMFIKALPRVANSYDRKKNKKKNIR